MVGYLLVLSVVDNIVCDEQKWLVYHPVLSVMDSNGWYIS